MNKHLSVVLFVCALVMGISVPGYCDVADLIDNLSVEKIVSVEVRPLFILSDQSFAGLREEKVPEHLLTNPNLQALKDQKYDGREAFVGVLEKAVGGEALHQMLDDNDLKTLFLRHAKQRPSSRTTHYLDVIVEIMNKNERDLKLTECTFEFFIHDEEAIGEMIKIGTDTFYKDEDIYLEQNPTGEPGKVARVKFSVEMGTGQNAVFDTIAHLLNFIGNPKENDYLFIQGKFNLGIKSEKGWTYAEAVRVEWMFCPTMQEQLPLQECFRAE